MKTSESVVGLKWTLFLGLLLARPAVGQISATTAPEPGSAAQQTEEDPLGRSTPYGTVRGFVRAAQRDDYSRAVQYLDTRKKEEAAGQLARQLQVVLDRGLRSDLDRLSRKPEGDVQDGLRTSRDRIGTIDTSSGKLEILVDRIDRRGQNPIWLFSSETLGLIPAAAEEMGTFGQGLLEKHVPRSLKILVFGFPLHRWISATIFLALALVLASLVTRVLVPLLRPALRRMTGEEDARILASIKAPIRLMLIALAIRLFSMMSTSLLIRHYWSQVAATVAVIGSAWLV